MLARITNHKSEKKEQVEVTFPSYGVYQSLRDAMQKVHAGILSDYDDIEKEAKLRAKELEELFLNTNE